MRQKLKLFSVSKDWIPQHLTDYYGTVGQMEPSQYPLLIPKDNPKEVIHFKEQIPCPQYISTNQPCSELVQVNTKAIKSGLGHPRTHRSFKRRPQGLQSPSGE
ncbi:ATP synthase gamma chain [Striga asiatica]|uniref:ATP synthase gamma chain n=1 Tax=Striga asiatica TaxID=4170 RepID=A0A5A7R914_STRAF|nr:ATP synthase gamma chain [Striga asiatica]